MAALHEALSESAARYAKRALAAFVDVQLSDFVLFAGISIEQAAKAKLARENAAFIAAGSFDSALAIHRSAADANHLPSSVRTIGFAETIERLAKVNPALRHPLREAQPVAELRNGEAHLGVGSDESRQGVLVAFLTAIDALLEIEPEVFWAPNYDVVSTALDEHARDITKRVVAMMASARLEYGRRFDSLAESEREALLAVIEERTYRDVDNEVAVVIDCPVCSSAAVAFGATDQTGWDIDYDRDGHPDAAWPILVFTADEVQCYVCGLGLGTQEELAEAGMETSWRNEEIDLDDWMRELYADLDS